MDVILLAAGTGSRAGLKYPKQFHAIKGKPMIVYSIEVLEKNEEIENIFICYERSKLDELKVILNNYLFKKTKLVLGGNTRQESVMCGLKVVESAKVMIHEAARPLISKDFVAEMILKSEEIDCLVPVIDIPFTVAIGDSSMEGLLDRSTLKNIQLPQIFNSSILRKVHELANSEKFTATEDSMLFFKYGYPVIFIEGRNSNIKITTPLDFIIANNLMSIGTEND
jgi:2-C-methyl-D-erythritol 4-phosphate cytidylyltransferase